MYPSPSCTSLNDLTLHLQTQLDLFAVFTPQADKGTNYNVTARVKGKPTPLCLNVKGEGYALRHALLLEMGDGRLVEMAPRGENELDFGQVGAVKQCALFLLLRFAAQKQMRLDAQHYSHKPNTINTRR